MDIVKSAVIGFGSIAREHKAGYDFLEKEGFPVKLTAVCDKSIDPEKFKLDNPGIRLYTDTDELLRNENIDMADICLPSYLHKEYAVRFLRAGKHVLSEKPMALNSVDASEILFQARESGKRLMIGQCLRFDPAYRYLKEVLDTNRYGKLRTLDMERRNGKPTGGYMKWYASTEKSGGALFDLHIHDVDMVRFLLGEPRAVSTAAMDDVVKYQHVDTRFVYEDIIVSAIASFDQVGAFPFTMGYQANFEQASIRFDGKQVITYPAQGGVIQESAGNGERMTEELRYFVKLILDEAMENCINPPESAFETIRLLEKLRASADMNGRYVRNDESGNAYE